MEFFLVVITAIAIWYFWGPRKRKAAAQPPVATRKTAAPASPPPKRHYPDHLVFAAELIGDHYHARTREQVDSMFSGAREELPRVRAQARAATRAAKAYDTAARKARPDAPPPISEWETALSKIRFMIAECERALESLTFERDSDLARYHKLIDDLDNEESEIEFAIKDIKDTTLSIQQGDYDDFWVKKPKPAKKPRR